MGLGWEIERTAVAIFYFYIFATLGVRTCDKKDPWRLAFSPQKNNNNNNNVNCKFVNLIKLG
jgi:hypothetical protein